MFNTMMALCVLSVIIPSLLAQEQSSFSINKPRTRLPKPWEEINSDHVRCFCNLPACVTTAYMCKSSNGGCFSDLFDVTSKSAYRGRHGCIESLTESQLARCPITDKEGVLPKKDKSLLVCCTSDMCNHADNPLTKSLINRSLDDSGSKLQHEENEASLYTDSEVWFRAATIAVPICGAVILFALIALAVKILKSENRNSLHHKLGSTMYVVAPNQKGSKWAPTPYKPCTVKRPAPYYPQTHPSTFGQRGEEQTANRQSRAPLLIASQQDVRNDSSPSVCPNKNVVNANRNLLDSHFQSTRSLILELGKETPNCFGANINVDSDGDKFSMDAKPFIV